MDNPELLSLWLNQYGAFAIFALLSLGIIALPLPEETLLVLAGVLMSKGHLNTPSTIVATYLGSITGITLSYVLGKTAGNYVFWGMRRSGTVSALKLLDLNCVMALTLPWL